MQKGARCCMYPCEVISSVSSQCSQINDWFNQFWVAHNNLRAIFQSHIQFARKVQKYSAAFSKSSSIYDLCDMCERFRLCWYISSDRRFPTMWHMRSAKAQTCLCRLIRAFASRRHILWLLSYLIQYLGFLKPMSLICWMRNKLLISIDAMWLLR